MVKNLPAIQEMKVRFLGQDPLEKRMATHSSVLAWRIPWTGKPGGLQSTGWQRSDTAEQLTPIYHTVHTTHSKCSLSLPSYTINSHMLVTYFKDLQGREDSFSS